MKVLFNRMKTEVVSRAIAQGLLNTNKKVFVNKEVDPFDLLHELSTYGLTVKASPVLNKNRKLTGYNFKNK